MRIADQVTLILALLKFMLNKAIVFTIVDTKILHDPSIL